MEKAETERRELIERLRRIAQSELEKRSVVLVDEPGLSVTTALSDSDVEEIVLMVLREARCPLTWREMKRIFQGIVGEDRLRKVLIDLKARGEVVELTRIRFALPEYVPLDEIDKVKNPGVLDKIYRRLREREAMSTAN
jgi:DNA polymerase III delta prime subunit